MFGRFHHSCWPSGGFGAANFSDMFKEGEGAAGEHRQPPHLQIKAVRPSDAFEMIPSILSSKKMKGKL